MKIQDGIDGLKIIPSSNTSKREHFSSKVESEVHSEGLPDLPIQLIRPDPLEHRKLEIITQNVKYLHQIGSVVAVIAVVGKFHSGKSFLLNQLMRKQEGFGIGPSVKPQTMGIWMWGKVSYVLLYSSLIILLYNEQPIEMKLPSGEQLSVIFLDTEGTKCYLMDPKLHINLPLIISSMYACHLGFSASNISESYDAKIFSVATLLSSYLIYNSVKVI